jgi:hypothetical protein
VRLQDKAQEIIDKLGQNTALIYRTDLGAFSLTRPVYVFPNNSSKNPVHDVDNKSIKRRQEQRLSDHDVDNKSTKRRQERRLSENPRPNKTKRTGEPARTERQ